MLQTQENSEKGKSKKFNFRGLQPLKSEPAQRKVFGFDIETANNNRDFVCCTIVGKNYVKTFYDIDKFKKEIGTNRIFRNGFIYATNLMFDFYGLFFSHIEAHRDFDVLEDHGRLIQATTYISYNKDNTKFHHRQDIPKDDIKKYYKIVFCDTLNHYRASVAKMGKILKRPKMKKPKFLGEHPKNEREMKELVVYNKNDAYITYMFVELLQNGYIELGASMKPTIASTSLDLFRRKYLEMWIKQESRENILFQYKGYYGGRTEALKRGEFSADNYGKISVYDVNSLYPTMLIRNKFPYPDGYMKEKVTTEDILSFEGMCMIELFCPKDLYLPLLPVKTDKLRFATGYIKGYYDFHSVREALKLGYEIFSTGKGVVYENKFSPFKGMMKNLYDKRMAYKKISSLLQIVPKIAMNGFYGKLGTNYTNKERIVHINHINPKKNFFPLDGTLEKCNLVRQFEDEGSRIPNYVFPLIPSYVTSYSRSFMYKLYKSTGVHRVFYTDTDCIFTTRKLNTGKDLGELKLENTFNKLTIVKPKFYGGTTLNEEDIIRIKGIGSAVKNYKHFKSFIKGNKSIKLKLIRKLRGAIVHKTYVNENYTMIKSMNFNDDKRIWEKPIFNFDPQCSEPMFLKQ